MSCVGRERTFEHFSRSIGIPVSIIRLNYACELRYGVLVDLAQHIAAEEVIDLSMGNFNAIWQADASAICVASLQYANTPPFVLNVTGSQTLSVRRVCLSLGDIMGNKGVRFSGQESETAILSNSQLSDFLFGSPRVTTQQLIARVANWIRDGKETFGKPTHFETREGKY
jgi:nucleoside-diphosphate-sugar epimerase